MDVDRHPVVMKEAKMDGQPFFTKAEYDRRLRNVRWEIEARELDACLISAPENIYYLTGLDHYGYFAYHGLIVPSKGEMILVARAMEQVTMETLLVNTRFAGYGDSADRAGFTVKVLRFLGLEQGRLRLGLEKESPFLPVFITEGIGAALPGVQLIDISGLVDALRQTKSAAERAYTRRAAAVADAMMQAAIETAAPGVNEQEVAAEVQRAMVLAGGELPGFGPFIRSSARLGQEHRTWDDHLLQDGEVLFVELAGCVRRYHAAMGRLIAIGREPPGARAMEQVCLEAFQEVVETIRPGVHAHQVYQAWQDRVDAAGLAHYRRHHCGYMIGLGMPPSWVGGSTVVGLRHDSDLALRAGMTFHLMSWLMDTGKGDYFVSDTAMVTEEGCEVLTTVTQRLQVV